MNEIMPDKKMRTPEINTELDYQIASKYGITIDVIDAMPISIVEAVREYFYTKDYSDWEECHG